MASREERRRRNGIAPGQEKAKTMKELEQENRELRQQVEEAQDALVELTEIITEGM